MPPLFKPLSMAITLLISSQLGYADTLLDVYELAMKNDAKLKAAEANYRANIEVENQALSALLPQVNATVSYEDSEGERKSGSVFELAGTPINSLTNDDSDDSVESYRASLEQTVFDLSAWYTLKSGKQTTKQAEAQLAYDQQAVIVRTAEAYFNVLRARDNLEAARAEERATQRQLEQTQQRFDVGLIAITDVHEARAVYDDTVVQRLTYEGNVGTAYEALTVLTGQTHANLWLLNKGFPVTDPNPMARDEWVDFALENNYSLKAVQYAMQSSQENAKSKKMEHAPTVTASYNYNKAHNDGYSSSNIAPDFTQKPSFTDSETTAWGVTLQVPIYSGGRVSAQRRQAYEQYNAARENEIDTRRTVIQATRSLHLTTTTDVQRVKARSRGIISTRSALEATQAGYEVGTRNIVDVLQAQRALYGSIRDYANSRYDYVLNMLRLKQQAGTLSPQDIIDLDKWLVASDSTNASEYTQY